MLPPRSPGLLLPRRKLQGCFAGRFEVALQLITRSYQLVERCNLSRAGEIAYRIPPYKSVTLT
jgi:hypothetical protein